MAFTDSARDTVSERRSRTEVQCTLSALGLALALGMSACDSPTEVEEARKPELSAGSFHTCTLDAGFAKCWGDNGNGQAGIATVSRATIPVRVATNTAFATLSSGAAHTCGLTADGTAYCWGNNGSGQLGSSGQRVSAREE